MIEVCNAAALINYLDKFQVKLLYIAHVLGVVRVVYNNCLNKAHGDFCLMLDFGHLTALDLSMTRF